MRMDMAVQDWKKELLSEIVIMRGRELPLITATGLEKIFETCGERTARTAVRRLNDRDTIPNNIVGVMQREISLIEAEKRERDEWKTHSDDAGTSDDCHAMMEFLTEILLWHSLGLVEKNPMGISIPMSIDEYAAAGRPITWSPIVDHWLGGFERAYNEDKVMPGALLDFLMRYNLTLKNARKERKVSPICESRQEFPDKMAFS